MAHLKKYIPLTFFLILVISGCRKGPQQADIIYSNDFENNDLKGFTGGQISAYNNSMVLGRYNKGGFELKLSQLPKHDLVEISFDLFIHDSWDGNLTDVGGPDIWKMEIEGSDFIRTTFNNNDCVSCLPQSYPFNYLNSNQNPRTGAYQTDLPGACLWADKSRGTSLYKIVKTVSHNTATFSMKCIDELFQSNTVNQVCDESWSVDNLVIKTIKLD